MSKKPQIFAFVGNSNSGKTTIISKIVVEFKKRNYTIGIIKHCPKGFDIDKKDKDSWRLKKEGADSILLLSNRELVLFEKANNCRIEVLRDNYFKKKDFIIIEGGKNWRGLRKIEVVGPCKGRLKLADKPIAVISDANIDVDVPKFSRSDIKKIVNFMERKDG